MYRAVQRLNEIKRVFTHFKVIETAVDTIIVLLMTFLVLPYLGIKSGWITAVPPSLYLLLRLKHYFRYNIIKIIEERFPSLKERLSTVYDNREEKNAVVEDLAASVLGDMEKLKYSSFIPIRRLGTKISIILILVILVLSSAIYSPKGELTKTSISPTAFPSAIDLEKISGSPDTEMFNESSYVNIGNETQKIMLYQSPISELNMPGERKGVSEYSRLFPVEETSIAGSSEIYTGAIPPIYKQIVKNYFTNLSGQG